MMMFHYESTRKFYEDIYTNVINDYNFKERKHFTKKLDDGDKLEVEGWLVEKDREKYIIPEIIAGDDVLEHLPIKVKSYEKFSYGTNVYFLPTKEGIVLFKINAKKTMDFRTWVDEFMNIKHSNPLHWTIYKLSILAQLIFRVNIRVSTNPGFGKDSICIVLENMLPQEVLVMTPKTAPKLMNMLERRLVIIDEVVDITKEQLDIIEPVVRACGDGRPTFHNPALNVKGLTKDDYDISSLSLGFIYNELKDYQPPALKRDKSDKYFDYAFTNATKERYFPLLLDGRIDVTQFNVINPLEQYNTHKKFYTSWVKMAKYLWEEGIYSILKSKPDYKWHKDEIIGSPGGRLNEHFATLRRMVQAYSNDEEEYNMYCDEISKCYWEYQNMLGKQKSFTELIDDNEECPVMHNDKYVGMVKGNKYITERRNIHFMKMSQSFGISQDVLKQLQQKNVDEVIIIYHGKDGIIKYKTELSDWFKSDINYAHNKDYQKFIAVKDMIILE